MVVEGDGDKSTVEGINSAQTVLGVTNPVADVVVPSTDKVKNGLFTPVFKILHIGELQTGRFFDPTRLIGPNRENPNQPLRIHFCIGVTGQFGVDRAGDFVVTG